MNHGAVRIPDDASCGCRNGRNLFALGDDDAFHRATNHQRIASVSKAVKHPTGKHVDVSEDGRRIVAVPEDPSQPVETRVLQGLNHRRRMSWCAIGHPQPFAVCLKAVPLNAGRHGHGGRWHAVCNASHGGAASFSSQQRSLRSVGCHPVGCIEHGEGLLEGGIVVGDQEVVLNAHDLVGRY